MIKNSVIGALLLWCIAGWAAVFYYTDCRLPANQAEAYRAGRDYSRFIETERILEIVRAGNVYLGPLEMDEEGQVVHDCIFICVDPNEPMLTVDANGCMVADSYFDMTGATP